jgi:hypothetical protein
MIKSIRTKSSSSTRTPPKDWNSGAIGSSAAIFFVVWRGRPRRCRASRLHAGSRIVCITLSGRKQHSVSTRNRDAADRRKTVQRTGHCHGSASGSGAPGWGTQLRLPVPLARITETDSCQCQCSCSQGEGLRRHDPTPSELQVD